MIAENSVGIVKYTICFGFFAVMFDHPFVSCPCSGVWRSHNGSGVWTNSVSGISCSLWQQPPLYLDYRGWYRQDDQVIMEHWDIHWVHCEHDGGLQLRLSSFASEFATALLTETDVWRHRLCVLIQTVGSSPENIPVSRVQARLKIRHSFDVLTTEL